MQHFSLVYFSGGVYRGDIMVPRLRNRQMQIPNGLTFFEPCTGWTPRQYSSFSTIVARLIASRNANPALTRQHHLATDQQAVEAEVDLFNAKICLAQGWMDYILTEERNAPSIPKAMTPALHPSALSAAAGKAKRIWAGVKTLNDWIDSGEPAVEQEEADHRAGICVACPLNGQGGLEVWFTAPASEAIKRQFQKLEARKLATPHDATLGICSACSCPMRLKVWTPMHFIKEHLSPDVIAELRNGKDCWIVAAL